MLVTALDVLVGIRFATFFDRHGYARSRSSAAKHCRNVMRGVLAANGHPGPAGNVITLSPALRRLQANHLALKSLLSEHCNLCSNFRDDCCSGIGCDRTAEGEGN
jgi:hypothetical protein